MKKLINGIVSNNPVLVLLLGLCPTLAVTTKVENAYLMGLCVLIILLISSFLISLFRKFIPENVKIPVYVLIIGTFVTITEMLLHEYIPLLYEALGVYLPLIVVNCIVLGRAIEVAGKESIAHSLLDALGIGIGFTLTITIVAVCREVIGTNMLTLMDALTPITGYNAVYKDILPSILFPINILVSPAGAFITLGLLIALAKKIKGGEHGTN